MEVKILGKNYSIKSDLDEEFTHQTAELVDRRIRELMAKLGPAPSERVAILAALNFAGELLQVKRKCRDRDEILRQKLGKISKLIEKAEKKA